MQIDKSGVYELDEKTYHSDCCVGPSLSSSGAHTLIDECAARFWFTSYLNPDREPDESSNVADFGTATHVAILEPERWTERVVIVQKDDWRTNEAKNARDDARNAGKVALLGKDAERVSQISTAMAKHPIAGAAFKDGVAERSLIYQDPFTEVWCKARPDYLRMGTKQIVQLKTVPSANPRNFARHAWDMGYFQRAAWEIETAQHVLGFAPDYWFVVQEREPPYLVSVIQPDGMAIEWGHILNAKAREKFAACIADNRWPGYGDRAVTISLPTYAVFQLEERHQAGEFALSAQFSIAQKMQAPAEIGA